MEPPHVNDDELREVIRQMTYEELGTDYQTRSDVNFNDLSHDEANFEEPLRIWKRMRHGRDRELNEHNGLDFGLENGGPQ